MSGRALTPALSQGERGNSRQPKWQKAHHLSQGERSKSRQRFRVRAHGLAIAAAIHAALTPTLSQRERENSERASAQRTEHSQ